MDFKAADNFVELANKEAIELGLIEYHPTNNKLARISEKGHKQIEQFRTENPVMFYLLFLDISEFLRKVHKYG